jgi:hypothetical protein
MPLAWRFRQSCRPYSVLLPVGFTLPPPLPGPRCALTAPFHPCPRAQFPGRLGGLFSVALSLGSPPPAVSRHRIPVEPGLSSTGVTPGSGRPAVWRRVGAGRVAFRQARFGQCGGTGVRAPRSGRIHRRPADPIFVSVQVGEDIDAGSP